MSEVSFYKQKKDPNLFRKNEKKEIKKIKKLTEKFDNIIVSVDLIIPQKFSYKVFKKDDFLIFDHKALIKEIKNLEKIFGDRLWLLSTTVQRIYKKMVYFCPVPFGAIYVMPNGKIVPCSRYPHLETGFNIDNFDLLKYIQKFDRLTSNFCLYENKYFNEFWDKKDNPKNFWGGV